MRIRTHTHTHTYICICTCTYRISSKSRHGGILFQGSIWCGDNSRVARFRGWRLQRLTRTRVHSFNNKPNCMHVKCACAYGYCCRPLTMRRDFEGGVYWDELADRCGDILRAVGFRGVAKRSKIDWKWVWSWIFRTRFVRNTIAESSFTKA